MEIKNVDQGEPERETLIGQATPGADSGSFLNEKDSPFDKESIPSPIR